MRTLTPGARSLRASLLLGLLVLSIFSTNSLAIGDASAGEGTLSPLSVDQLQQLATYRRVDLAPDSAWLTYKVSESDAGHTRFRILRVSDGQVSDPGVTGMDIDDPEWSPDSEHLAFHSGTENIHKLSVWNRRTGQTHTFADAEFPDVRRSAVKWFNDGRRLLVPLWPEGRARPARVTSAMGGVFRPPFSSASADKPSVYVYRSNPKTEQVAVASSEDSDERTPEGSAITGGCEASPFGACDLGIVDIEDGSVRRIAKGARLAWFFEPSPDGRQVAYVTYQGLNRSTQLHLFEIHLIHLASGKDRLLARDVPMFGGRQLAWSPDGRHLAFLSLRPSYDGPGDRYRARPADLNIISIEAATARRLGDLVFDGGASIVWSPDSKTIYSRAMDRTLRQVNVISGATRPVVGLEELRVDGMTTSQEPRGTAARRMMISVEGLTAGAGELRVVDLLNGNVTPLFVPSELGKIAQGGGAFDLGSDGSFGFITVSRQSPGNLWLRRAGQAHSDRIGDLNRFLTTTALGGVRQVHWRSSAGRDLSGALMLPPGWRPGQRPPLLVWAYGGRRGSELADDFGFAPILGATFNAQMFAGRGYAVFTPDIPQRLGTPLDDIVSAVVPGVDAMVAQGYADPDRLAIMGHSYGSYTTLALTTHSTRFKAAIISGVVDPDLVAVYTTMRGDGLSAEQWAETGQGLIGGPPWEFPGRYLANSPIYQFDHIRTPFLIQQGDMDVPTPITGANSVFVALRRLGVQAEYRVYADEGHGFSRPANVRDVWAARFRFLSENLNIALDDQGRVIMENGQARSRSNASLATSAQSH